MSKPKEIIKNALEYYDKNNNKYRDMILRCKYYSLEFYDSDMKRQKIIFYDKYKEKIFESDYEQIGLYNHISKTWTWAWSIPTLPKNEVYLSRRSLTYGLDIIPDKSTIFLKTELVTSRFRVLDKVQLDMHVSLASYLAKIPFIFKLYVFPKQHELEEGIFTIIDEEKLEDTEDIYQIYYLFILDYENVFR